jgi:putative component of membrane protein insertase Oxa1/YidC/SpoIIIJ protein YidD
VSLARDLLLAAIRGYKRHVSPRKGFACAYRVHMGACSCSTLGLRAISRYGAWRGAGVLRLRLRECHLVAQALRARHLPVRAGQAGFIDCDLPCDGSCIDVSSCSCGDMFSADSACEAATCVGCDGCDDCGDWSWGRGKAPAESRQVRRRRRRGEPLQGEPAPEAPPDEPSSGT